MPPLPSTCSTRYLLARTSPTPITVGRVYRTRAREPFLAAFAGCGRVGKYSWGAREGAPKILNAPEPRRRCASSLRERGAASGGPSITPQGDSPVQRETKTSKEK